MSADERLMKAAELVERCERAIDAAADLELPSRSLTELAKCPSVCAQHPQLHAAFHVYEDAKHTYAVESRRAEREAAAIEAARSAGEPIVELALW